VRERVLDMLGKVPRTTHYSASCAVAAVALRYRCQAAQHVHHGAVAEALGL